MGEAVEGPTLCNSVGAPRKSRRQKNINRDRIDRAKDAAMAAQVAPRPEPPKTGWTRDNKIGVASLVVGIITLLLTSPEGRNLLHRPSDSTPEKHSEPVMPTDTPPPAKQDQVSGEVLPRPQPSKRMKPLAKKRKAQ